MSFQINVKGNPNSHPMTHMEEHELFYECPLCMVKVCKAIHWGLAIDNGKDFMCEGTHVAIALPGEMATSILRLPDPPIQPF